VLRALAAAEADIPALTLFPASHRVTFKYYRGVIAFLEESYTEVNGHRPRPALHELLTSHFTLQAEAYLTEALEECHRDAHKNHEYVLSNPVGRSLR
jgi:hypothetical protein